jgi:hypothetical protein
MLDPDLNEQADIERYRRETGAGDSIGISGAPLDCSGFHILLGGKDLTSHETAIPGNKDTPAEVKSPDFLISAGRMYVDGILCENETVVPYSSQADLPGINKGADNQFSHRAGDIAKITDLKIIQGKWYLVYLDCWKQLVTATEEPRIREVALGGPDTSARSKVIPQVKVHNVSEYVTNPTKESVIDGLRNCQASPIWNDIHRHLTGDPRGRMSVRIHEKPSTSGKCDPLVSTGYSGRKNQLYRVEIHTGGQAGAATFKWSRENGSILAACSPVKNEPKKCSFRHPVRDTLHGFEEGSWVEITDDDHDLWEMPGQLVKIVGPVGDEITVSEEIHWERFVEKKTKIRQWDNGDVTYAYNEIGAPANKIDVSQNDRAIPLQAGLWYELEENIQISFDGNGTYRSGDYWLIPARTLEPEKLEGWEKTAQAPWGPDHHYCPLALLYNKDNAYSENHDCRPLFPPASGQVSLFKTGGDGQEIIWDPAIKPDSVKIKLARPLRVAVARGRWPAGKAVKREVLFTVKEGTAWLGEYNNPNPAFNTSITTTTDDGGEAYCDLYVGKPQAGSTTVITVRATIVDNYGDQHDAAVFRPGQIFTAVVHAIDARQMTYSPKENCPRFQGVETVKAALDALCKRPETICTIVVNQADWDASRGNWQEFLSLTGQDIDLTRNTRICFQAGTFTLPSRTPLKFIGAARETSHILVTGSGPATRIIAPGSEAALVFKNWKSAGVMDLAAESDRTETGKGAEKHINGTLTFLQCSDVTVERVEVKCGEGIRRAASCINVRDAEEYIRLTRKVERELRKKLEKAEKKLEEAIKIDAKSPVEAVSLVRIRDCTLHVGHRQAGILLVNVRRSDISGNVVDVYDRQALPFISLLMDKAFCRRIVQLMVPVLSVSETKAETKAASAREAETKAKKVAETKAAETVAAAAKAVAAAEAEVQAKKVAETLTAERLAAEKLAAAAKETEAKAKKMAETRAAETLVAEAKVKKEAETLAAEALAAETRAKEAAEAREGEVQIKKGAEAQAKKVAEARAAERLAAEARLAEVKTAEAKAKKLAEVRAAETVAAAAKAEILVVDARAEKTAEAKTKKEAAAREAEAKTAAAKEAEAQAKKEAEEKAAEARAAEEKAAAAKEAETKAKREAEEKAAETVAAEARSKKAAELKVAETLAAAAKEAEAKAIKAVAAKEAEAKEAETKAAAAKEAETKAKRDAEARAVEAKEAEAQAKKATEAQAKKEAETKTTAAKEAEAKAKRDAEARAAERLAAEAKLTEAKTAEAQAKKEAEIKSAAAKEAAVKKPAAAARAAALYKNTISFTTAKTTLTFAPLRELNKYVQSVVARLVPDSLENPRNKYATLIRGLTNLLSIEGRPGNAAVLDQGIFTYFDDRYKKQAFGSQGIVVAGQYADDIHICNNALDGVAQGIHVGLSQRESRVGRYGPLSANIVHILDNTISVRVMHGIHSHHGIFTGNCNNQIIRYNHISITKMSSVKTQDLGKESLPVAGIEVNGNLGPLVIIGENHVIAGDTGILVSVHNHIPPKRRQWLVADNYTSGRTCFTGPRRLFRLSDNVPP